MNLREYRQHVRTWHDASTAPALARTGDGRLVLRIYAINGRTRTEVVPAANGGFDEAARARAAEALMDTRAHQVHPLDPRLLDALYQVAQHFDAPEVRVISGYRAGDGHSNHASGRAVDFLIPGVSDARVAEFARSLGAVGVGLYPVSGFVHLDVRDQASSWIDDSAPGRRARYRHRRHRHRHAHR